MFRAACCVLYSYIHLVPLLGTRCTISISSFSVSVHCRESGVRTLCIDRLYMYLYMYKYIQNTDYKCAAPYLGSMVLYGIVGGCASTVSYPVSSYQ